MGFVIHPPAVCRGLTQIDQGSVNWNGNGDNLDEIWCLSMRPLTSEGEDE